MSTPTPTEFDAYVEGTVEVPPQWPRATPCKLGFIAEAPGLVEEGELRPLVGPSGWVFNQMLRAANIDRAEVFVSNLFNRKAPDNDVGPWLRDKPRCADALARLRSEVARADPTVLVPLGGPALWALTGNEAVSDARGAPAQIDFAGPRKLIATYHPAFVMRVWKLFHIAVGDLIRAATLADMPREASIPYDRRELWCDPTITDLWEFKRRYLDKAEIISVDLEWMRAARQITHVGFSADSIRAICVPFVDYRKPSRNYWPTHALEMAAWRFVDEVCRMPQPKLLQNGTADAFWLWHRMGIPLVNYSQDTRLLHHALYPELPKDLGFMGANYTLTTAWKLMREKREEKRDA